VFNDGDFEGAFVSDRDIPPTPVVESETTESTNVCGISQPAAGDTGSHSAAETAVESTSEFSGELSQPPVSSSNDLAVSCDSSMVSEHASAVVSLTNVTSDGLQEASSSQELDIHNLVPSVHSLTAASSESTVQMTPEGKGAPKEKLRTPEEICPFPKAGMRKKGDKAASRRRGETLILTDTPVKRRFEEMAKLKQTGREKTMKRKKSSEDKTRKVASSKPSNRKKLNAKKLRVAYSKKNLRDSDAESTWKCFSCGVVYGEQGDARIADEWLQCVGCSKCFHESCAESTGIIDDDDSFTCRDCCA